MTQELRKYFSLLSSLGITYHEGDRITVFPWQGPLSRRDALVAASQTANLVGSGSSWPSPFLVEVVRAARAATRHWFGEVPERAHARPLNFDNLYDSDGRFVAELADQFAWEDITAVLKSRACSLKSVALGDSGTDPLVNTADILPLVEVVGPDGRILAGGNGATYQEAKRAAVAEGVERLLAQTPPPGTVFLASALDLRQDGLLVPNFGEKDIKRPVGWR